MSFQLNKAQALAANTLNQNVALIAGAGTGKTRVLTERFLNLLSSQLLPKAKEMESILAITFTEKAALEMKQRIGKSLEERSKKEDSEDHLFYERLLQQFSHANISTIHSFCLELLKKYPVESKVDSSFKIIEETEGKELYFECASTVVQSNLKSAEVVAFFTEKLGFSSIQAITKFLCELDTELRNRDVTGIQDWKFENTMPEKQLLDQVLLKTITLSEKSRKNASIRKFIQSEKFSSLQKMSNEDANTSLYIKELSESLGTGSGTQELREDVRLSIASFQKKAEGFNYSYYEIIQKLLLELRERHQKKKRELKVLDFDDLMELTRDLLKDEYVLSDIQKQYTHIMIDEFQDVNRIQSEIFEKICSLKDKPFGRINLFVVGDPKQSIYGFRGSNVDEFNKTIQKMEQNEGRKIYLTENYRTNESIIDFVNMVFSQLMETYHKIEAKGDYKDYPVEIFDSGVKASAEELRETERKQVGKKILQLHQEGVKFKDIALLFRASTHMDSVEKYLNSIGIPCINSASRNFFSQREIKDLLLLLSVIANSEDEVSLVGLLRSPLVGLNDTTIHTYFKNKQLSRDDTEELSFSKEQSNLYKRFFNLIHKFQREKYILELGPFVETIVETFLVRVVYSVNDDSGLAVANINKLIDMAWSFQEEEMGTFDEFVIFLKRKSTEEEKQAVVDTGNAVQLMTIHGSKGLEFPVVFLMQCNARGKVYTKGVNFTEKLGLGLKDGFSDYNFQWNKEWELEREEEELIRLFYVACTRAKEHLILSMEGAQQKVTPSSFANLFKKSEIEIKHSNFTEEEMILKPLEKVSFEFPQSWYQGQKDFSPEEFILKKSKKKIRKKSSYSVSEFLTFRNSKEMYYYRYILSLENIQENSKSEETMLIETKDSGLTAIELGNVFHKYAELFEGQDRKKIWSDIFNLFEVNPSIGDVKLLEKMAEYFEKSLDLDCKIYREVEFFYPLKEKLIHGFIDQIRDKGDHLEVWDYKTNILENSIDELVEIYESQIQLYCLAAEKIFNKPVKFGILFFARKGIEVKVDISEEAKSRAKIEFELFLEEVESPKFEKKVLSKNTLYEFLFNKIH